MNYVEQCFYDLEKYISDIENDKIIVGKYIKLLIQKHKSNYKKYIYKKEEVAKVFEFFSLLNLAHEGKVKPFILTNWQLLFINLFFGWYKDKDTRLYKEGYITISRKQGKSQISAALILYAMFSGHINPYAYLLAVNKQQARIVFEDCKNLIKQSPNLNEAYDIISGKKKKVLVNKFHEIEMNHSKLGTGFIRHLASDESTLDGLRPVAVIQDEFHEVPNNLVFNLLYDSLKIKNSWILTITTAGFNTDYPNYKKLELCGQILEGKQKQENILPMLFLMDENDNIEPLKNDDGELKINPNWYKSNPSLGITYDKELILEDYIKSKNENNMNNFLTKSLNIYTNASTNWIPDKIISKNFLNYDITFFKNKKVNIGIDLSINTDFSVINLITEVDEKYYTYPIFHFVDNEKTKVTNYNIKKFINSGLVTKHKNSIDIDIIFNHLIKLLSDNQIEVSKIYYDKFNASVLAQKLFDINLNIEHFQQTIFRYNLPTKQTEKMIFDGDLYFPDQFKDIIKHSFNNVVIIADANNNIKPAKNKSKGTIDYIVSLIMAVDGYNNVFDFSDLSSLYD